ncbi:hypothetical protein H1P_280013 [Hyella patelloides LEGE 07179]|uniref:Uncharacterized protein n=1 Tax=Hyella patelloides LEGE 07179 TaxID=945734 RepID=A0A563VT73_9CYAN|nr:hypothetical protein H1P_280013 [Hyella patelloides LEGE 07179]
MYGKYKRELLSTEKLGVMITRKPDRVFTVLINYLLSIFSRFLLWFFPMIA